MALYDPAGMATAGKFPVHILSTLASADLSAVTVAELTAGTQIDTALTSVSYGEDQSTRDRKMLSDTVAEQIGGQRTQTIDLGTIAAMDPQSTDALTTLLAKDSVVYIVARPGIASGTAPAAAQKVWVTRATVGTRVPSEITTDDGNEFGWNATFNKVNTNFAAVISA